MTSREILFSVKYLLSFRKPTIPIDCSSPRPESVSPYSRRTSRISFLPRS
jgi:hypothetical protein